MSAPVTTSDAATAASGASAVWCDRCGEAVAAGSHDGCAAARELEPPRFCAHCRRRMKVQVLPVGWAAVCVEHGEIRG
ncbi:biotin synthase auxiliary protein BsaP [Micromonospora reichwaldensis]|uniref:biotin synthase auxiliary protein BsaP n=1 Tax=Micromonospora reichwaldensis TaxID=3075516 RepID=UPI0037C8394F